jgi:hypothetical protein
MQPMQRFAQQIFGPNVKVENAIIFPALSKIDGFPINLLPQIAAQQPVT